MDKYDIILEMLQEKVDNDELTLEEAELINEEAYNKYMLEKYEDIIEAYTEGQIEFFECIDYICEASGESVDNVKNSAYKKAFNDTIKEYKSYKNIIKSSIKSNDKKKINNAVKNAEKCLNKLQVIVNDTPDDLPKSSISTLGRTLVGASIGGIIGLFVGKGLYVNNINEEIKDTYNKPKTVDFSRAEMSAQKINTYKGIFKNQMETLKSNNPRDTGAKVRERIINHYGHKEDEFNSKIDKLYNELLNTDDEKKRLSILIKINDYQHQGDKIWNTKMRKMNGTLKHARNQLDDLEKNHERKIKKLADLQDRKMNVIRGSITKRLNKDNDEYIKKYADSHNKQKKSLEDKSTITGTVIGSIIAAKTGRTFKQEALKFIKKEKQYLMKLKMK